MGCLSRGPSGRGCRGVARKPARSSRAPLAVSEGDGPGGARTVALAPPGSVEREQERSSGTFLPASTTL